MTHALRFLAPLALMLLTACAAPPVIVPTPAVQTVAEVTLAPSATPTASATPTPASTPTPTPLPRHPLEIEMMRATTYPGGELVFEETLSPGSNYSRYIVSYPSEGLKIYAYMTVPEGDPSDTGWPVIIFNHGYIPPDVYRSTERYVAYVDGFARHGYIVFRSDYRGHGFSEGQPTGGYSTPAYTVDVLNGMYSVMRYDLADPNRVGMWGHSMGGQITLRSMVVVDDIRAGVIWGGVVSSYPDIFTYWWDPRREQLRAEGLPQAFRSSWRDDLMTQYGTPDENPGFWASVSPNTYLQDLSGPIQLHHGTDDETVPFVLSELLEAEMQAAGLYVDFWRWDGDDHNISTYFNQAMTRSIQFFDDYVK